MTATLADTPATFWRRLLCMSYEALLLIGPLMILTFAYSALLDLRDDAAAVDQSARLGLQLFLVIFLALYFSWSWSGGRVTLPMQTLQMVLVDAKTGGVVSLRQAVIRFLVALPVVVSGIGLLWCLTQKDRLSLYDQVAGTQLMMRPRQRVR